MPARWYPRFGKRLLDIVGSGVGLVLVAPILLVCAAVVRLTSPGPAVYRQARVGLHGRIFRILKFRTMVNGADRLGPGITRSGDCRITPVGRWLRATKLDELPQLWNVLRGDMSLVGPRPELPHYVSSYTDAQKRILQVRPGITDPASLVFRGEERLLSGAKDPLAYYQSTVLPRKIELGIEGLRRTSLKNDLLLILQTILKLRPKVPDGVPIGSSAAHSGMCADRNLTANNSS